MASVVGPIVTGVTIRNAAESTLRAFMPDYLAAVSELASRARGDLPMFRSWTIADDVDNWSVDQLPACIVMSPGIDGEPVKESGTYTAWWSLAVAVVVSAKDKKATRELVELYTAAVRACLLQHPSLPAFDPEDQKMKTGPCAGIEWVDESYDDADESGSRTLGAGRIIVSVKVEDVLNVYAGLSNPTHNPESPLPDPVTITEAHVDVRKVPIA